MTQTTTMVWSLTKEPDFLEWEVKWALGSITTNKASGGDAIPAELFRILRDDAVKVLNISANLLAAHLENSAEATGLDKVSFHSNPKEKQCRRMFKLPHNCTHLTCKQSNAQNSPSQASTVHEPWTCGCSSWIRKGRRTRDLTSFASLKKQEVSRKISTFA